MNYEHYFYYAAGVLVLVFVLRAIMDRLDSRENSHFTSMGLAPIRADHEVYQDPQRQSQTDFEFFSKRFMTEIDSLLSACQQASNRDDLGEALRLATKALHQIDINLGRDHWYAVHALSWIGHLKYREGYLVEARDHWQIALNVGQEWPHKVGQDLEKVKEDLARCVDLLGF